MTQKDSNHPIIQSSNHPNDDLSSVTNSMNNMYRLTRHVYDITRKYYLLGRDRLINELDAKPGEVIVEVGCGTARNLIKMARKYPNCHFYGLDASEEQLKTARESIKRAGLEGQIIVKHGFAQNFDPGQMFGIGAAGIDKIVFSYALSMIPPWKESIDHALAVMKTNGEIHIVDFGDQRHLPTAFRKFLFWWLDLFGVHFRPELTGYLEELGTKGLHPDTTFGAKGYYLLSRIRG